MVPRKYLAKLSQTRISLSCRSCFLLKKCSSPSQTFNTQKRSKRRGREAVERANDRSSDAESFFLKTRGPFSSTSFSRFSSPSSLSRDVQSSINNLAPTVSINRHWYKARRGARVQREETEAGRSPRAPRFNRSRRRSWKTELWTSYGDRVSYDRSHIVRDAPSSRSSRSPSLGLDYKQQEAALHGTRRADKSTDYAERAPTGNKWIG